MHISLQPQKPLSVKYQATNDTNVYFTANFNDSRETITDNVYKKLQNWSTTNNILHSDFNSFEK